MLEYMKAFIIKVLIFGTLTFSIFGIFTQASTMKLTLMTLIVSTITFIGDIFILPRMNQALAIIGDLAGIFVLYWLLGSLVVDDTVPVLMPALAAAYFGTMAEAIYHLYILERLHEPRGLVPIPVRYQTEFAQEEVIDKDKNTDPKKINPKES